MRVQSSEIWRGCKRLSAKLSHERKYHPRLSQPGRLKRSGRNFNRLRAVPPFRRNLSESGNAYQRLSTF